MFWLRLLRKLSPYMIATILGVTVAGLASERSSVERATLTPSSDQAPAIACEGDQCWWADLPRPVKQGGAR